MTTKSADTSPLAVLQRLEGAQSVVVKDPETGKFLPKGETPATTTEPEGEPVAATPQAEAAVVETTADPAMGKALTALRRAQTPQSVIDKLTDAERLEWGQRLSKQQADTDRLYRSKGKDPAPKSDAPAQAADAKEAEDGTPEPDGQEEQASDPMAGQMLSILASQARTQLAGEFPQLNDPKVWAEIREQAMERFTSTDAYDNLSEDWSETAAAVIRDTLAASKYRPSPSAPSPARSAGHKAVSKPEDRYAGMKGTPKPLLILQLMENEGMTPQRAHEIAKKLGA